MGASLGSVCQNPTDVLQGQIADSAEEPPAVLPRGLAVKANRRRRSLLTSTLHWMRRSPAPGSRLRRAEKGVPPLPNHRLPAKWRPM